MSNQITEIPNQKKTYSKPEISAIGHISKLINGGGAYSPTDGVYSYTSGGDKMLNFSATMMS